MKKWIIMLAMVLVVAGVWLLFHRPQKQDRVLTSLPPEQALSLRSLETGGTSTIIFSNATAEDRQLEWLDYQGRPQPVASVAPHATLSEATQPMHAWLCLDARGNSVALFQARPGIWKATIDH